MGLDKKLMALYENRHRSSSQLYHTQVRAHSSKTVLRAKPRLDVLPGQRAV